MANAIIIRPDPTSPTARQYQYHHSIYHHHLYIYHLFNIRPDPTS